MSFDNYYCELEDDDCFAIIPHYLYNSPGVFAYEDSRYDNWADSTSAEYIDILVFKKKIIFRIWKKTLFRGNWEAHLIRDKRSHLYIIFTIEENLFNNRIIIDLYGIKHINIISEDIFKIPIFSKYLEEWNSTARGAYRGLKMVPHEISQLCINTIYNFEDYLSSIDGYSLIYKSTTTHHESTTNIDKLLLIRDNSRANIKNVLIYKLYHLCTDLRESYTKQEILHAKLELKCVSYVETIETLQQKCNILEIENMKLKERTKILDESNF